MKLLLTNLKIRNFKGIKEQDISFDPLETTICGENATGKTTVMDAFTWLLFEKDSLGRSKFEIKTLDENGNAIHGLDHSVEGIFRVDGRPLKLKKTYKEIWTKKKGEEQETFTGHEIERLINDTPAKKSEYDDKINELVDESIFQLLTDPRYFSQQLSWQERRRVLFELTGETVTPEDVFDSNPKLRYIENDLEGKSIEDLKKALSYQRRELNKEREGIPIRIDTLHGTIREIDGVKLSKRLEELKESAKKIEWQLIDASRLDEERLKKQDELYRLKSRQKEIEYQAQQQANAPNSKVKAQISEYEKAKLEIDMDLASKTAALSSLEKTITRGERKLEGLRNDYRTAAKKEFICADTTKACPTCKRPFSDEEILNKKQQLEENFKQNQVETLMQIRDAGQAAAKEVDRLKNEAHKARSKIKNLEGERKLLEAAIADREKLLNSQRIDPGQLLDKNKEYQELKKQISSIETELKNSQRTTAIGELSARKRQIDAEAKEVERELHYEEINKGTRAKIKDLMIEEKRLSQEIAEIEKKEHIADEFINTRAEIIERSINEKFDKVSFRLFKRQVNGALDETCDVLVDGVPFDNANTAGQVNAGLDVINSLCKHYDIYTPIFIDNRESVNDLIDTDSQIINLKVTRHKNLRIETTD